MPPSRRMWPPLESNEQSLAWWGEIGFGVMSKLPFRRRAGGLTVSTSTAVSLAHSCQGLWRKGFVWICNFAERNLIRNRGLYIWPSLQRTAALSSVYVLPRSKMGKPANKKLSVSVHFKVSLYSMSFSSSCAFFTFQIKLNLHDVRKTSSMFLPPGH